MPTTLEITWDNSSGVPLAEWIYVTFEVSYCGAKGTYKLKTAIPRQNGSYKIDQNSVQEFSTWLINKISNLAPTSSDPNAVIALDKAIVVKVTPAVPHWSPACVFALFPIRPTWESGKPEQTTNDLTVTFEHVLGN